jgi:sigma-B regulation protein RsbU (phosphoserine phosphatase)
VPIDPSKTGSFDRLKAVANGLKQEINTKRSLTVAKKRQRYMLPQVPEIDGYEFAFVYSPAEQISGDFCDIIDLGSGRFGILVGDISGHGVEAGIVMGAARKALQIYARSADNPTATLTWANDDLARDLDRETFLTAGYAVLNTRTGALTYGRAGHTHPLLVGPAAGEWQEIKTNGTMIGVTRGERFTKLLEEAKLELKPGQSFIQYTDGIIEARDRGGTQFGVDRFIRYLAGESKSGKTLLQALEGLPPRLDTWTGGAPQEDDITALAVRRKP